LRRAGPHPENPGARGIRLRAPFRIPAPPDARRPALTLSLLPDTLAVCRLSADAAVPVWAWTGEPASVTRTRDELSVVCRADAVPEGVRRESGWRCLMVEGPLDFALTGILAAITAPLAEAGIPLFAVSTFDTDYLLVKADQFRRAMDVLRGAGHRVT
jgi:hypothetical protein